MRLPNHAQSALQISKKLNELFRKIEFAQLARGNGLIVRERKLTAAAFVRLCVLESNITATSLEQLSVELLSQDISITKQSLNERFNQEAVNFLKQVLGLLIEEKLGKATNPEELSTVTIADSTTIILPENLQQLFPGFGKQGSWSAMKIFFEYDLKQGVVRSLEIYPATENDYQKGELILEALQARELLVRDLGFYKLDCFAQIDQRGAYFLSRYKTGTHLYADNGQRLDLVKLVKKIPAGESREFMVYVGSKHRVGCRLIVEKFNSKIAAQRRRKLCKQKKANREPVSQERLELCSCTCYITNLPADLFALTNIQKIYSLRWQIEIMFKAWKSIFKIDHIKAVNPYRVLCFIYGKLIAILLCTAVLLPITTLCRGAGRYISELKSFKLLLGYLHRLIESFVAKTSVYKTITLCINLLWQKARKEKKKSKSSAIDCFACCLT